MVEESGAPGWRRWVPVLETALTAEMQEAPNASEVHGRDYVLRVLSRCVRLGEGLGADLEVLVAAVYLHDLGRHHVEGPVHGALSAMKAEPVLERIDFPEDKRAVVLHAIRVHDVSADPKERTSLESRILYDADKVDTLGVVGVLRYIRHDYGKYSIDVVLDDIDRRWDGLSLAETREMSLPDYDYIKDYFVRLKGELGDEGWPEGVAR